VEELMMNMNKAGGYWGLEEIAAAGLSIYDGMLASSTSLNSKVDANGSPQNAH